MKIIHGCISNMAADGLPNLILCGKYAMSLQHCYNYKAMFKTTINIKK